jgi:hypothetical protein
LYNIHTTSTQNLYKIHTDLLIILFTWNNVTTRRSAGECSAGY